MRRSAVLCMSAVSCAIVLMLALLVVPRESSGSVAPPASDSTVLGVFVGRTPCGSAATEFTGFPAASCEKIKWELTLYHDRSSGAPAGYMYRGTRSTRRGAWSVRRGAAHDPGAVVYLLHYEPDRVLALLSVGDNVLLVLDRDLSVLVGDASWSYTLNRTTSQPWSS